MTVWILASLLSLAVLLLLVLPLFRRTPPDSGHEAGVYADQAAEIEHDRTLGLIDQVKAETLTEETKNRLAKASANAEEPVTRSGGAAKLASLAVVASLVVLVPVFSFAVYGWLGKPSLPGLPYAERRPPQEAEPGSLRALVANLTRRMREEPDRLEGWQLLGRSSMQLKDYAQAAHAFRQAARLMPGNPIMHANLAEALFMAAGQSFDPGSVGALDKALEIEPRMPKALFYQGLAHRQAGDNRAAVQRWTDLLSVLPPNAPYLASIREKITEAAKEGGIDLGTIRARIAPTKGPIEEDMKAASDMSVQERRPLTRSMVDRLAPQIQEKPRESAD